MQTKLVLLGTGTPNACPNANGPSSAVVVGDRAYLVDFGPGVVRQASAAYFNGVDALRPDLLTVAFCSPAHGRYQVWRTSGCFRGTCPPGTAGAVRGPFIVPSPGDGKKNGVFHQTAICSVSELFYKSRK